MIYLHTRGTTSLSCITPLVPPHGPLKFCLLFLKPLVLGDRAQLGDLELSDLSLQFRDLAVLDVHLGVMVQRDVLRSSTKGALRVAAPEHDAVELLAEGSDLFGGWLLLLDLVFDDEALEISDRADERILRFIGSSSVVIDVVTGRRRGCWCGHPNPVGRYHVLQIMDFINNTNFNIYGPYKTPPVLILG
jgi:hypothetical protein